MSELEPSDAIRLPIAREGFLHSFDGTHPHETAPYAGQVETRLSIIFFQSNRGWNAPESVTEGLSELGFSPAASPSDAQRFSASYDLLADGRSHAAWPVSRVDGD